LLSLVILLATFVIDAKAEIQGQYDRWSKAYMARDVSTLIGILSPDYSLTDSLKHTMSYDVYIAKLRLMRDMAPDSVKYSTAIKSLTVHGDLAEAVSVETMASPFVDPKTQKAMTSLHRHEYLDSWIHYDAGWRLRRTVTRKESTELVPAITG